MKDEIPQNIAELIYGEGLKEGMFKPGDQIDDWVIDEGLDNDQFKTCIYKVHHKDNAGKFYSMKIREPEMERWFKREVKILQKLNKNSANPCFQRLVANSDHPLKLYMIFEPFMPKERNFFNVPYRELMLSNVNQFLTEFFEAIQFAAQRGVNIATISNEHLFLNHRGGPFFLGLVEEPQFPKKNNFIDIDISLISAIADRFCQATLKAQAEDQKRPIFRVKIDK